VTATVDETTAGPVGMGTAVVLDAVTVEEVQDGGAAGLPAWLGDASPTRTPADASPIVASTAVARAFVADRDTIAHPIGRDRHLVRTDATSRPMRAT
jgi:hypothetical protein